MPLARTFALCCALLAGALGCSRTFAPPSSHRELGQVCSAPDQCGSGFCADGVCCASACGGSKVCNLPGALGACQDRPLGTACGSDTMCPTGFCRDGVCCDSACADNCFTCAVDGGAGHCQAAPDNTDPHHDCGVCAACFAGDCGPAFADTDPHQECEVGRTCSGNYSQGSAGACGIADGYPCSDDSCAGYNGYCVAWRCMEVAYFHVDDYPFLRTDRHRRPLSMAVGPRGDAAVLVNTDDGPTEDGGYLGSLVAAVAPSIAGPWRAAAIEYNALGRRAGAAAFIGDIAYFAVDSAVEPGSDEAASYGYSGVYVQAITSAGQLQGFENPDPGASHPAQIALASDAHGSLTLATVTAAGELRVTTLGRDGRWGEVSTYVDGGATGVAVARAGDEAQTFYVADGSLRRLLPGGRYEQATGMPEDCQGPLAASTAPDEAGDQVGLTLTCDGQPYLVAFAPTRTDVARWRVVPGPTDSPYYGLEDDGTRYPLTQFLPSGGRAGSVIFTALEPGGADGAPRGGYTQTLWLNLEGSLSYSYAASADNAYRYVTMAASATASGAPVAAFDSVVDIDGGAVTGNATLLIQTYFP